MKVVLFQFGLFGINTYLVYDPASLECVIIDPGMSTPEEEAAINGFIERNNLKLTNIINTHLHIDHVVGVPHLKEKYGVPLLAHPGDESMGKQIDLQAKMFGLEIKPGEIAISSYLKDGDKIKIGNGALEVIEVPGHSKGSICLYDKQDDFLISGDALFQGSIGRTDLPGGNYRELIESITSRLMTLPENTVVFPGHGPSTTIGDEKRSNPFL